MLSAEIAILQKEKQKLKHKLQRTEFIIETQKNSQILGIQQNLDDIEGGRLMDAALTLSHDIGKKPYCKAFSISLASF